MFPSTAPGKTGPPNDVKSSPIIAITFNWSLAQTPLPTNNSPISPDSFKYAFESNNPTSSPSLSIDILSSKINNVDDPVSAISKLKWELSFSSSIIYGATSLTESDCPEDPEKIRLSIDIESPVLKSPEVET